MPIKIPESLPAAKILEAESVPLITEEVALRQDIRPLRIALVNLMPEKIRTETQIARLLGHTPLQIELSLIHFDSHHSKNTAAEHILNFYEPWRHAQKQHFDGLIVTGAPVEHLAFEDVDYWTELAELFDWAQTHVTHSLNICWSAQAALYHYYGIEKTILPRKRFGIFRHRLCRPHARFVAGIDDVFWAPVSRHAETKREDLNPYPHLEILADSEESGLCLVQDGEKNHLYMFNHVEYEAGTLREEFVRDCQKNGADQSDKPQNYFSANDTESVPPNNWRSVAHLMFRNWINRLYQETPYEIDLTGKQRYASTLKRDKNKRETRINRLS